MNNTYKIDANTPHPNFLGSLYAATIATTPANNDATTEMIEAADGEDSHNNHAISHPANAAIRLYRNQFFIPAILYIIYK